MNVRLTLVVLASLAVGLGGLGGLPTGQSTAHSNVSLATADTAPALTNLAHLDWLGDTVDPPDQAGHTTYLLAAEPELGVLWTYAEPRNGVLTRVGGGTYDPLTNTYTQGAFNAAPQRRQQDRTLRRAVAG